MVTQHLNPVILALAALLPGFAQALVTAELDRHTLAPGETVQLTVSIEDNEAEPDFSDLEANFEILQRRQVQRTQIVNGRRSQLRQRIVVLAPRREGRIRIPPIRAGNEASRPLEITVRAGAASGAGQDAFVEVLLSSERVYRQAELLVTVQAWYRGNLDGNLTSPAIDNALVEQLGEQQSRSELRDGIRYQVVERRYVVYPQQAGTLEIPALTLSGTQSTGRSGRAFDPFGPASGRRIHVRSREQRVEVLPIPPQWPADQPWLPARDVQFSEHWSQDLRQLREGQAVTRTLRLRAVGQMASALPALRQHWPDRVKVYPDQPRLENQAAGDSTAGQRIESSALIPLQPGPLAFAPIELLWWDTTQERIRSARIPARSASVAAATSTASPPPEFTADEADATPSAAQPALTPRDGIWPLLTLLCLGGWLVTAALWAYTTRGRRHRPEPEPDHEPGLQDLRRACAQGEPAAARRALQHWAHQHFGLDQLPTLAQVSALGGDAALRTMLGELDRHLYANASGTPWDGKPLWRQLQQIRRQSRRRGSQNRQDLPSLYPS